MELLSVTKIRGSDPPMYVFWSKDEKEQRKGYMGHSHFVSEEDLRQMLMKHGSLTEAQANAELSKVGEA